MSVPAVTFPQDVMLARSIAELPTSDTGERWRYEPKFDGFRAVVFVEPERVLVQSRGRHDISDAFPDLVAGAAQLPVGTVLDGEAVIWGGDALDFPALAARLRSRRTAARQAAAQPASFLAFDVLAAGGLDLRARPLAQRREVLEGLLAGVGPPVQLVPQTADEQVARGWLQQYALAPVGVEGLVVKAAAQRYLPGRRSWDKLRLRESAEAIVGAVTGPLSSPQRLVLGLPGRGSKLTVAGSTGPLSAAASAQLARQLTAAGPGHPWPAVLPARRLGVWARQEVALSRVEPVLVVEVSADTAFEHGRWRHLVTFLRARPDLEPADVRRPAV